MTAEFRRQYPNEFGRLSGESDCGKSKGGRGGQPRNVPDALPESRSLVSISSDDFEARGCIGGSSGEESGVLKQLVLRETCWRGTPDPAEPLRESLGFKAFGNQRDSLRRKEVASTAEIDDVTAAAMLRLGTSFGEEIVADNSISRVGTLRLILIVGCLWCGFEGSPAVDGEQMLIV